MGEGGSTGISRIPSRVCAAALQSGCGVVHGEPEPRASQALNTTGASVF